MKEEVTKYFKKRVSEVGGPRLTLEGASFNHILEEEKQVLVAVFEQQEIKEVI